MDALMCAYKIFDDEKAHCVQFGYFFVRHTFWQIRNEKLKKGKLTLRYPTLHHIPNSIIINI